MAKSTKFYNNASHNTSIPIESGNWGFRRYLGSFFINSDRETSIPIEPGNWGFWRYLGIFYNLISF